MLLLIAINYLVAALLGFTLLNQHELPAIQKVTPWLSTAILIGSLFVSMFFLIGISAQKAGIAVTATANKISVVFPVAFSILFFREEIAPIKYIAFLFAFAAVLLMLHSGKNFSPDGKKSALVLPMLIFLGSGITDSTIKYAQAVKIGHEEISLFSAFVFLTAFVITLCILPFSNWKTFKVQQHTPTLVSGMLLGTANFGSLYFMMASLNHGNFSSPVVFAVINVSTVLFSALAGVIFFKEKLSRINIVGVLLAICSLLFLA